MVLRRLRGFPRGFVGERVLVRGLRRPALARQAAPGHALAPAGGGAPRAPYIVSSHSGCSAEAKARADVWASPRDGFFFSSPFSRRLSPTEAFPSRESFERPVDAARASPRPPGPGPPRKRRERGRTRRGTRSRRTRRARRTRRWRTRPPTRGWPCGKTRRLRGRRRSRTRGGAPRAWTRRSSCPGRVEKRACPRARVPRRGPLARV